jgi:2-iminobutanoate/2-iminopropanoate deaminase
MFFVKDMTERKIIAVAGGPAPIGPYSHGVRVGNFVYLSGQIPITPDGGFAEGITAQTEQVIANIKALLAAENLTLSHVIKASVFMADLTEFAAMNAVYEKHFAAPYPARSTFQVARLPRDARVEIEVIAHA